MTGFHISVHKDITDCRCFLLIILLFVPLQAQIDSLAEEMMEEDDEQGHLIEWIETMTADPLDLNNAPKKILTDFPFLTAAQVDLILKNRPFSRKTEIARLLGKSTYQRIRPFVELKKTKPFLQARLTQRWQYVLEKTRAFKEGIFTGAPFESMTRLRIKIPGILSAGLLIQKDVGEPHFDDHLSAYFCWNAAAYPLKFIAGNFYIHCAEGLLFSSSYLSSESGLVRKPAQIKNVQLKPMLSASESSGFWGTALQWKSASGFELTTFYSDKKKDAVLSDGSQSILRFEQSGYHRNADEMQTINKARETSLGFIVTFPLLNLMSAGISYAWTKYSPGFAHVNISQEKRRDYFRFEGSRIENYSLFYSLQHQLILLKGEVSPLKNSYPAQVHSLYVGRPASIILVRFSCFPRSFSSAGGQSLSNSNPSVHGSQHFLIEYSAKPTDFLDLSAFCSFKKDLWRTYFNPMPQLKKNSGFEINFHSANKTSLSVKHKLTSEKAYHDDFVIQRTVRKWRFQIEKNFGLYVRLRSRVELSSVRSTQLFAAKSGVNFYQDLHMSPFKSFSFSARFSSFQCDDYDARIYEFESGIPGIFSNYPLYGSGNKFYLSLSFIPFPTIKVWLKYRQIYFDGAETIGSGLNEIEGPLRQDLQFQLEYNY